MENATKALEMAGSILIGILILGCLVFVYSKIAETEKIKEDSERAGQAADFNKDYEAYNRDNLYGSDMFSLANKIENYNIKEADGKSYQEIEIIIVVNQIIGDPKFFNKTTYNVEELNKAYKGLTEAIRNSNEEYFGKKVSYWSNYGTGTRLDKQLEQELRTR